MPRSITFDTPTDPVQFGPMQARPRVLMGLAITSLARWFAAYLVPYSRILDEHHTGFAFTTVQLENALPDLRFTDADWYTVTAHVTASDSAKYLHLRTDIEARLQAGAVGSRPVATFHADMRVVTVVEPLTLSGEPGVLPKSLFDRFLPDEIYRPDRSAITRATTPPDGNEIFRDGDTEVVLYRSQCEVADQWSFIEVLERLTANRERLFVGNAAPADVGRLAVAQPVRKTVAVFHRAMYVFDTCNITTRLLASPDEEGQLAFVHTLHDPAHPGPCLTAWEIVPNPPRPQEQLPQKVAQDSRAYT